MSFFTYLKFLFSATNQHGVHSPFVYALVTKGLYVQKKYSAQKSLNLLLKVLAYLPVNSVKLIGAKEVVKTNIMQYFPHIRLESSTIDFWYLSSLEEDVLTKILVENRFKNDSVVFIDHIYQKKEAWEQLISSKKITVSIDLFYAGLVFFRKEQVKQHFRIRT